MLFRPSRVSGITVVSLFMGFAMIFSSAASASSTHEKVKSLYQSKHYHQAVKEIERVKTPDQLLHYYKALCLQATGRVSAAKAEYDWVKQNATSAVLRSHAEKGLKQLGGSKIKTSSKNKSSGTKNTFDASRLDPRTFFFTQLYDPKYNYKAPKYTRQCGPTCLAMVFKRFGKLPPGAKSFAPQELIKATRILMTGKSQDRGTYPKEVKAAAEKMDFLGEYLEGVNDVAKALDTGSMVVMAGCPFPNSYGYRVGYKPFRNGHFVLLVCRKGGQFICNDPAYQNGPIALSSGEVKAYTKFRLSSKQNYLALRPLTEEEIKERKEKEKEKKDGKEKKSEKVKT